MGKVDIIKEIGYRIAMIYLILTLLVYQAETKYFLTENKEGPVKHHHLVKIEEPPANKPEKKDEPKTGEDGEDGENGADYNINPLKNVHEKKSQLDDTKAYKSAKKVYLKYINLHKRNVQAGTFHLNSTNEGDSDEENYRYSDEENYVESGEESYVDVTFE